MRHAGRLQSRDWRTLTRLERIRASHLADNGFILRYPQGANDITGYSCEPWHFRYVGSAEIAHRIMDNRLTLEEYLASRSAE